MKTYTCISCGNEFTGNYCNRCGEKVIHREDRKLKHFFGEFINAITFADSKFWLTIKYILFKPGRFSRDFVDGKRNAYMRPISVFFFANLIYFLFPLFNTFNTSLHTQTNSVSFTHSTVAYNLVMAEVKERDITYQEYEVIYNAKTAELSKLLLIIISLLLALFFALIHYKKKFLIADHFVISLELMTFVIIFAVQLQGVIISFMRSTNIFMKSGFFSELIITSVALSMITYFFIKMERNFYRAKKWNSFFNVILCLVSFIIVLYTYRALLFFVTFWSV